MLEPFADSQIWLVLGVSWRDKKYAALSCSASLLPEAAAASAALYFRPVNNSNNTNDNSRNQDN